VMCAEKRVAQTRFRQKESAPRPEIPNGPGFGTTIHEQASLLLKFRHRGRFQQPEPAPDLGQTTRPSLPRGAPGTALATDPRILKGSDCGTGTTTFGSAPNCDVPTLSRVMSRLRNGKTREYFSLPT
jgi:hypothetical protein